MSEFQGSFVTLMANGIFAVTAFVLGLLSLDFLRRDHATTGTSSSQSEGLTPHFVDAENAAEEDSSHQAS